MGNTSARDGKSRSSDSKERGQDGRLGHSHSSDSMSNTPPDSPGSAARSPLMFTPQIPMVPISKGEDFSLGDYPGPSNNQMENQEQGIPTMIVWSHDGNNVSVEGSWDNWTTRQVLQKSGKDFTIVKMLPPGAYQYKFIVDDVWRFSHDLPAVCDEMGNVNNILEVQEYIPENLENIAGFDPPRSPPSSYTNPPPVSEDYVKEPPLVPPHLHLSLLNVPASIDIPTTLPRPQHVILDHLYVEKGKSARSVLALGLTHRFRSKYVTLVLYKPLQK